MFLSYARRGPWSSSQRANRHHATDPKRVRSPDLNTQMPACANMQNRTHTHTRTLTNSRALTLVLASAERTRPHAGRRARKGETRCTHCPRGNGPCNGPHSYRAAVSSRDVPQVEEAPQDANKLRCAIFADAAAIFRPPLVRWHSGARRPTLVSALVGRKLAVAGPHRIRGARAGPHRLRRGAPKRTSLGSVSSSFWIIMRKSSARAFTQPAERLLRSLSLPSGSTHEASHILW